MGNEGFPKSEWESSAFCRITCIYRVCTDFWIQNSRLFLDYFQDNSLFSQTRGYQIIMWSIGTLKNAGTRLFFMMHGKLTITTGQCGHERIMRPLILWLNVLATGNIESDLTNGKKIHLLNTCCNVEKENNKKIFPLFYRLFPRLENYFANFKDIFKNSRPCTNPVYIHWWFPGLNICYTIKLHNYIND